MAEAEESPGTPTACPKSAAMKDIHTPFLEVVQEVVEASYSEAACSEVASVDAEGEAAVSASYAAGTLGVGQPVHTVVVGRPFR